MGKARFAGILVASGAVALGVLLPAAVQQPVQGGSALHVFVDGSLIRARMNVQLTLNPPRKTYERNIVAEHAWEGMGVGYSSVMEDGGQFRMWYECNAEEVREAGEPGSFTNMCYATSSDGIHWRKPMLGVVSFRGSTRNNIVLENVVGTIFIDPKRTDGERFKFAGRQKPDRGLVIFTSPDGLRWKRQGDKPVLSRGQYDTQNVAFWDARLQKYVAYVRRWDREPDRLCCRQVGRSETADLKTWPEPEIVFGLDKQDPAEADVYTPAVIPYPRVPGLYLMFPSFYYHYDPRTHANRRNLGPLDIHFAASRDGIAWQRVQRAPYVGLGPDGAFDSGALYMAIGMFIKGDEIWMYYTSYDFLHGDHADKLRESGVISRLVQRVDGFVSADASYEGGELTTVPISISGTRLALNIDTGALGTARVELLDETGRPIAGYRASDSDIINGNATRRIVTWKGNADLSSLRGRTVALRFVTRSTKLYAFQFVS
ncbi:MAG: hypothetical protein ACREM1_23010 [Longimicrobiales bacterium]